MAHAAHTQVKLLLSATTVKPGETIWVGVDMQMDAGWHTYWKNPGDAGLATKIEWQLPPGVTAGEIKWPLPEKLPPAEVTTYGYEHEVVLLVPLTLAAGLKPGPLVLQADISWLECKEQCVPGKASVAATLNISSETKSSNEAALIKSWQNKVPQAANNYPFHAAWEKPATGDTRPSAIPASARTDEPRSVRGASRPGASSFAGRVARRRKQCAAARAPANAA